MNDFTCKKCNYSTNRKSNLLRHSKTKHSNHSVKSKSNQNINGIQEQDKIEYSLNKRVNEDSQYQKKIIELEKELVFRQQTYDKNIQHILHHCHELQHQLVNQHHNHAKILENKERKSNECLHKKELEYHNSIKLLHKKAQDCIDKNGMLYQKCLDEQSINFEKTLDEKIYALAYPYSCHKCGLRMMSKIELKYHRKKKHAIKKDKRKD